MSKLDTMTGFRGGVVYAAAGVLPATVHSWALEVGEGRGSGHKRYTAIDAVMLSLMKVLTVEAGLAAGRAASVLNSQREAITSAVAAIVAEQELQKAWRWDGGPYLHIKPASSRVSRDVDRAHILTDAQLVENIADQNSGMAQIVVALPRNVCRVLVSLENVIRGDKPAASDD